MHTQQHHHSPGPGTLLPFPTDRARPPAWRYSPLREERVAFLVGIARQAESFRDLDPVAAERAIAATIRDFGADAVARLLDNNSAAIAAFSAVLATLTEADRRIAQAADAALTAAGLPSSAPEVCA